MQSEGETGLGEVAPTSLQGSCTAADCKHELSSFLEHYPMALENPFDGWRISNAEGVRPCAWAGVDIAMWDLRARLARQPLYKMLGLPRKSVATSITIGIIEPELVRDRVLEILERTGAKFLKIKLGNPEGIDADRDLYMAIKECTFNNNIKIRVDANGGWSVSDAREMMKWLHERECEYVEQPLHHEADNDLPGLFVDRPLPIFVDESCNFSKDASRLSSCVDGVNVKLMKCGGITEAMRIVSTARAHGMQTMIGCMGESSVAIGAGASIAALFDYIDLDSHLNLDPDPAKGLELDGGFVNVSKDQFGHGITLA